ncbi:MAG: ATP-binding protein [Proteobacteria bacterium]|nr:ATP-binding protein [Pseudomonadota bacterium]
MNKTLVLSATLENLEPLIAHARSFATDNGMDPKLVYQVELSLEEVLVNVISYAYPQGSQGNVAVNCSWEVCQGLTIEVVDYGDAFDPLAKPDPDTSLSLDERSIGGLGIFLTKKMMDKVTYDRCQGKNILTMIKHCQVP